MKVIPHTLHGASRFHYHRRTYNTRLHYECAVMEITGAVQNKSV